VLVGLVEQQVPPVVEQVEHDVLHRHGTRPTPEVGVVTCKPRRRCTRLRRTATTTATEPSSTPGSTRAAIATPSTVPRRISSEVRRRGWARTHDVTIRGLPDVLEGQLLDLGGKRLLDDAHHEAAQHVESLHTRDGSGDEPGKRISAYLAVLWQRAELARS
jgi:hypothetical protein